MFNYVVFCVMLSGAKVHLFSEYGKNILYKLCFFNIFPKILDFFALVFVAYLKARFHFATAKSRVC